MSKPIAPVAPIIPGLVVPDADLNAHPTDYDLEPHQIGLVPLALINHDIHGRPLPRHSGRLTQWSIFLKNHVLSIHGDPIVCHVETTKEVTDDIDLSSALAHPRWSEAMQEE